MLPPVFSLVPSRFGAVAGVLSACGRGAVSSIGVLTALVIWGVASSTLLFDVDISVAFVD